MLAKHKAVKMSSFEHLDALRRLNKELLQKLKRKTENLQRQNLDCSIKLLENETKTTESVCDVWKLVNSSARDRKPLTERSRSSLNVSDAFINLSVSGTCSKVARNALCKPRDVVKTSKLAGEKPETEFIYTFTHCHFRFRMYCNAVLLSKQIGSGNSFIPLS